MYAEAVSPENADRSYEELYKEDSLYREKVGYGRENPAHRLPALRELHYWRKHHALHNWMEMLYWSNGGTEEFNGIPVGLSLEDLEDLERDVKARKLSPVGGFFFGSTDYSEDDWDEHQRDDLEFIEKAREVINDGGKIYYDSSW